MQKSNKDSDFSNKKNFPNKSKNSEANPVDTNGDKDMTKPVRGLPRI